MTKEYVYHIFILYLKSSLSSSSSSSSSVCMYTSQYIWRSENTSMQSVLYSLCESQSLKSGHRACIVSAFSELSCWPHAFLFVFFFKVYLPTYPLTLCWPWNRTAPPHSPAPAPPYSLAPSTTRPLPTVPALPTARPLPTVRLLPQPDPSLQLGSSHNPAPPIA